MREHKIIEVNDEQGSSSCRTVLPKVTTASRLLEEEVLSQTRIGGCIAKLSRNPMEVPRSGEQKQAIERYLDLMKQLPCIRVCGTR
jgi:hypothetical protein